MNVFTELTNWYQNQCDGDWEHKYGVSIETLDNPGWIVKIVSTLFSTLLVTTLPSLAGTIIQSSLATDYAINETPLSADQSATDTNSFFLAGAFGSNGQNGVYIFSLPQLESDAQITGASLALTYLGSGTNDTSNARVDLWGIGFQTTTEPILEYLEGDFDPLTDNFKIQNNIANPGTQPGQIVTDSLGNQQLSTYLQSFYDANLAYDGQSFVFFRINPDQDVTTSGFTQGYRFATSENMFDNPTLTISSVPEPTTLIFLFVGAISVVVFHRLRTTASA